MCLISVRMSDFSVGNSPPSIHTQVKIVVLFNTNKIGIRLFFVSLFATYKLAIWLSMHATCFLYKHLLLQASVGS